MATELRSHFANRLDGDKFENGKELLPVCTAYGFSIIAGSGMHSNEPLFVRKAHFALWKHVEADYDKIQTLPEVARQGMALSANHRVTMMGNPGIGKVSSPFAGACVPWSAVRSMCDAHLATDHAAELVAPVHAGPPACQRRAHHCVLLHDSTASLRFSLSVRHSHSAVLRPVSCCCSTASSIRHRSPFIPC